MGEQEGILKKPAPDSVEKVLKLLGVPKENAVYIGDSDVDIETARNAGMDEIIVGWGFRTCQFLKEKGAKQIVFTPEEIAQKILL